MIRGIIGIDEAGRGPLAGPVSVGVCYIPKNVRLNLRGIKDSKKLSEKNRDAWFLQMKEWQKEGKMKFTVSLISQKVIDKKGIVYAISLGVTRCLEKISLDPHEVKVLLDGGLRAPQQYIYQKTIIKGDEKFPAISLASIAAKVTRDKYMRRIAKNYPQYGFEVHKGYGTVKHRQAIVKHKPSILHRQSFLRSFQ